MKARANALPPNPAYLTLFGLTKTSYSAESLPNKAKHKNLLPIHVDVQTIITFFASHMDMGMNNHDMLCVTIVRLCVVNDATFKQSTGIDRRYITCSYTRRCESV